MGQTEPNSQDDESDDVRVRAFAADRDRINAMRQGTERQPDVLRRVLDAYEDDTAEGRVLSADAVDEIIEEVAERVEPEQGYIDDDKIARAVAAKIDYAELGTVVAKEVQERLR